MSKTEDIIDQVAAENGSVAKTSMLGVEVIRGHLKTLPGNPGVYRMINDKGDVLYVGKAKK